MGKQYYMGDIGPGETSSFFRISPPKETTCITMYIVMRPKSEVDRINKAEEHNTGPFFRLN
jgi:hypothetical protein